MENFKIGYIKTLQKIKNEFGKSMGEEDFEQLCMIIGTLWYEATKDMKQEDSFNLAKELGLQCLTGIEEAQEND